MYIDCKNKQEMGQVLDILLNLGYLFHNEEKYKTSEDVLNEWTGYTTVCIHESYNRPRSIALTVSSGNDDWSTDFNRILTSFKNFKVEPTPTSIEMNVGDYTAVLTKGNICVNDINISEEVVNKIYELTKEPEKYTSPGRMDITTSNDQEHKSLMALLHSFGFGSYESFEEEHNNQKEFTSTVVTNNRKYLGGNYQHYHDSGRKEYHYSSDLVEIYQNLQKMANHREAMPIIDDYYVSIDSGFVHVGCQSIPFSKIEEIVNTLKKLQ